MYALETIADGGVVLQANNVVEISHSVNTVWVLLASFLVFFMQPGFSLLEAGQVQAKNVANVAMKNLMDWSLGILGYFLAGLGIASLVGAATSATPLSIAAAFSYVNDPTAWVGWLFGAVFAMTAATIVSGAVAGRVRFSTYVWYAIAVSVFIYPVVQGITWQGGLLSADGYLGAALGTGYMDFAGGTIVHMTGGIAGLVAAALLGPRKGRFDEDGNSKPIPGHSAFLAMLGTFVLAFGWYGFNVGTQATILTEGGAFNGAALGRVALNTTLGMGAGTVASALVTTAVRGDPDPLFTANGMLAGLVAVTAGAAHVTWWGGLVLGAIGGATVMPVHRIVVEKFQVDDVCGVFGVHGVPGAIGAILIPVFAVGPDGGWQVLGPSQFAMQLLGVTVIALWAAVATILTFRGVGVVFGTHIRVDDDDEEAGLDVAEHSIAAYPEFTATDGGVDIRAGDEETGTEEPAATESAGPSPSANAEGVMWRGQEVTTEADGRTLLDVGAVVDGVTHPALVVDATGTVRAVNDRALALFGADRQKVVDSPVGFDGRVDATVGDVVDEVAGTHDPVDGRVVSPDDWDRTLSVSADGLRAGDIDGVLVIVRDVTEETDRRQRQRALAEYRDRELGRHREKLERLAAGHLDLSRGIGDPDRESGDLSAAHETFDALDEAVVTVTDNVRAIVEQLPDQSRVLANKSASLNESGQEVMEAADNTAALTTEIEDEVGRLSEQASEVQTNVQDQSAAIEQISASATEIREQSSEATELTERAVGDVRETVEEIRAATEASEEVLTEIDDLEDRMGDVADIVDVIQGIAEQTNILALNASIEAAHADADGDGFAVVAEEVKSLAEEAGDQATRIARIVESAEDQTADVVAQVRSANTQITERTEALTDVVDSLETAQERVSETNTGVREITDAVDRQAETASSITAIIEETTDRADDIEAMVQRISTNADDQSETLAEVAGTAEDLSDLAAEVDANVDAFDASAVAGADD